MTRLDHHSPADRRTSLLLHGLAIVIIGVLGWSAASAQGQANPPRRGTVAYCQAFAHWKAERVCIIRVMWHSRGQSRKAVSVADCETGGTFSPRILGPNDETGRPRVGVWQFGYHERRTFGYGTTVVSQTRAAIRYYDYERRHGRGGWGPWACAR